MFKIVLQFGNGNIIEGVSGLSFAECKRRINNYLAENGDTAKREKFKFFIVGVDN